MSSVEPRHAVIAIVAIAAVVAASTYALSIVSPSSGSTAACNPQGRSPPLVNLVALGGAGGNFDLGLGAQHATTVNLSTPSSTSFFCILGNFSASYATGGFTNVTGNRTVQCSSSVPQCYLSVGLWTPEAWASFASGGSAQPIWCYNESHGACGAQSSGSYHTGNLGIGGGAQFVYAMWTDTAWNPWGPFQFSAYVNAP